MVSIRSRSSWGARAPRSVSRTTWSARRGFTVHHSAGPPTQSIRSIQDFHMDGRKWSDIGYNLLVDRNGTAYEGRGWLVVGSHAAGFNTSHIGVCFVGSDGHATDAARATIRALYDEACKRAGRRLSITGHRDLNSTTCPGSDLYQWVRAGMPTTTTSTEGDDDVIGLRKGDKGERVKALQLLIQYAGRSVGKHGADGRYGDDTAEGLRLVRQDMGSRALSGYGDTVTSWAYAQLMAAVARKQGKE
ncbi:MULTISPECIES: N-acetylmuramoyl-L-alanine amidase [unclassified Nocardiopsis]|uniref:N-acetylmuramoyl-L-alanine amidase n=1 Tax=unclassified Nocardiopsis TaxID=2649073 RepID=UPI0013577C61|nr:MULTISPECIES: N-acetylmuramoyl-L-alanine amidase [unclassified Nocardiopsis]